jgi:Ran GTPase-activating protein (RanGAP) involved in mRNA processing and transport
MGVETELDFSSQGLGAGDAVLIANDISDMRALSVLSLKSNNLQAAGGEALAEGLKGNQVITELDISSNNLGLNSDYDTDTSGIIALADAIPDMRAMTKFNISSNDIRAEGGKALAAGLTGNQVITELNISRINLGRNSSYKDDTSGVIAIADAIPNMRALSVANIMGNKIGKDQLAKFQEIMRSKPNLVSLCGIANDATGADLSGLDIMDADDAIILVSELPDKGAMTSLNLASNDFGVEGAKFITAVLPKCT